MTSFRRGLAAALLGGVAALGHAPFGFWYLALPALAALIWLVADAAQSSGRVGSGWTAWFAGVGYFGISMHWIVEPFLVDVATHGWLAPLALVCLAGGLALFWACAGWLSVRFASTRGMRAIAFAVLLGIFEVLRGHIFTGFPWAMVAYIWADTPLRAATAYTGSYGLSVLTFVGVALPATLGRYRGGVGAALVFIALYALGAVHMSGGVQTAESLGQVRLVQPNVPQNEKWVPEKVPEHFSRFRALSQDAKEAGNAMVVWPEAAIVYPLERAGTFLSAGYAFAGVPVVTGINRRGENDGWHNSLVVVGPNGSVNDAYDKVHLVPFGEYIPFKLEFIRAMAASSGFGFTPGNEVHLIDTPLGRALPLICYEGIFPGQIGKADARADYLLLITNDAWFGTFSGPYQHLDQARFRAAEQGLSLVRVANTGISAVIDPFGNIDESLDLGTTGFSDQAVPRGLPFTLYARTGDLPVVIILLLGMAALLIAKSRNTIANRSTTS